MAEAYSEEPSRLIVSIVGCFSNQAETVSAWLKGHPHIDIVSRDGSSEYASAISKGAPQARQVSDRWHLVVRRIGAYSIPFGERRG